MAIADALRESMSAVIDGEGSELDLARVLRAVDEEPGARLYWQRLQEARTALCTGQEPHGIDVSAAVRSSLDSDRTPGRQLGPLGSLAVAASVTFAVVLGGQSLLGQPPAVQDVAAVARTVPGGVVPVQGAAPVQARFGASNFPGAVTATQPEAASAAAAAYEQLTRERFERFASRHAQSTAHLQSNAFVPYARVPDRVPDRVPEQASQGSAPSPDQR